MISNMCSIKSSERILRIQTWELALGDTRRMLFLPRKCSALLMNQSLIAAEACYVVTA